MASYVDILQSRKDSRLFVGHASDLRKRLTPHNVARVKSTKHRRPLDFIDFGKFINRKEANEAGTMVKAA